MEFIDFNTALCKKLHHKNCDVQVAFQACSPYFYAYLHYAFIQIFGILK